MIDLSLPQIVLLILAAWRVSYLIMHDDAPFGLAIKLRGVLVAIGATNALSCIRCMSVWIAGLLTLLIVVIPAAWWFILWMALSGGVCLVEKVTTHD